MIINIPTLIKELLRIEYLKITCTIVHKIKLHETLNR